jgi:uncharacterized membrane protein/glutaredoxin
MIQTFRTNLANVAILYAKQLQIPITAHTLKEQLEQNPYFPNLYSLRNVFDKLSIANEAYNINKEELQQFQPPFIAYYNNSITGKDFILVTEQTNREISYISEKKKVNKVSREQFLNDFQEIVFVAEPNSNSGDKDYSKKLKKEKLLIFKRKALIAGGIFLLILSLIFCVSNLSQGYLLTWASLILIKLLGIATTILLLIYDIDRNNNFVRNICTVGKQANCDAVLGSKDSKILGISWGEIGFFYFLATTFFILLPQIIFSDKIAWLQIASITVSPYILFSIYYQWRVVKQWCPLCLMAQAVLLMELIWSVANYWKHPVLPIASFPIFISIAFCIILPIVAWYSIKPIIVKAKMALSFKAAYRRLLYNPSIFNQLLQQQVIVPDGWQQLGITIGNPSAANTIIKVCNPYCNPCAKAHAVLEEIIQHNSDINLKIIFTATNDYNDRGNKPVKHLLAIAAVKEMAYTQQAVDDWYLADKKDYEIFAQKYSISDTELYQQELKIDAMTKWCKEAKIIATPTIFINGKKLPETYNIDELKYVF